MQESGDEISSALVFHDMLGGKEGEGRFSLSSLYVFYSLLSSVYVDRTRVLFDYDVSFVTFSFGFVIDLDGRSLNVVQIYLVRVCEFSRFCSCCCYSS